MNDHIRAGQPSPRPLTALETPDVRRKSGWPLWVWLTLGAGGLFMLVATLVCGFFAIPLAGFIMFLGQ